MTPQIIKKKTGMLWMHYIKTAEADAVPKMPEQSSTITNVHNRPSLKEIQQQIWQFCFQFP